MKRLVGWLVMCLTPLAGWAQVYGTVDAVHGPVNVVNADGTRITPEPGYKLMVGQTVQTEVAGELHAVTEDGGFLALRPQTTFKMQQYQATQDSKSLIDMSLLRGALRSITGWIGKLNPNGYRITTSTATVGIRGTDHEVTVIEAVDARDPPGTYDRVLEGKTVVRTPRGEVELQAGQHGFAGRDVLDAPRLLTERPGFLEQRALRLEDRIAERKEKLGQRVRQVLDDNPELVKAVREKLDGVTDEQRENARKKLLRRAQRRNHD